MAQLPMLLSSKLVLLLILILGLMGGKASTNSDSNEDEQLRQALFLVNLLKSEYVKVLRENIELKKGSDSVEEDNSTCPTTVEDPSLGLTTHSNTLSDKQIESTTPQSSRPPMSSEDPSSLTTSYPAIQRLIDTGNNKRPSSFNGRRMMPGQSNKYDKLRRDDYDAFNNEHPEETETPATTSTLQPSDESDTSDQVISDEKKESSITAIPVTLDQEASTSPTTLTMPPKETPATSTLQPSDESDTSDQVISEKKESSITAIPVTLDQETSTSPTTLTMPPKESPVSSSPKGLKIQKNDRKPMMKQINEVETNGNGANSGPIVKLSATTATVATIAPVATTATTPSTTDNVMSQVASELMNEMHGVKTEKAKIELGKIHMWLEKTDTPQFMRSSIKVHLEGSSRYPIPLPENHAFCHTNPYNPLCRTLIG